MLQCEWWLIRHGLGQSDQHSCPRCRVGTTKFVFRRHGAARPVRSLRCSLAPRCKWKSSCRGGFFCHFHDLPEALALVYMVVRGYQPIIIRRELDVRSGQRATAMFRRLGGMARLWLGELFQANIGKCDQLQIDEAYAGQRLLFDRASHWPFPIRTRQLELPEAAQGASLSLVVVLWQASASFIEEHERVNVADNGICRSVLRRARCTNDAIFFFSKKSPGDVEIARPADTGNLVLRSSGSFWCDAHHKHRCAAHLCWHCARLASWGGEVRTDCHKGYLQVRVLLVARVAQHYRFVQIGTAQCRPNLDHRTVNHSKGFKNHEDGVFFGLTGSSAHAATVHRRYHDESCGRCPCRIVPEDCSPARGQVGEQACVTSGVICGCARQHWRPRIS